MCARGRQECYVLFCVWGGVNSSLLSPPPPVGRQVSQRLAEEAKKRERFEELKQHLEQEQEVVRHEREREGKKKCVNRSA